jgi:hypothetical protein
VGDEALQSAFCFASNHLQEHGCVIVFHSWSAKAKSDIARLCETYDMLKKKEWMGMNHMHLTSAIDKTKTVNFIRFLKLLKELQSALHSSHFS